MSSSTLTSGAGGISEQPHDAKRRGHLRVFLGYAAGVGKTCRMLEEAHAQLRHGKDVVVGYFEPHDRKDTIARTVGLEMVPTQTINYRGVILKEMDTPGIITRKPAICVVDELAHTNVPGSGRRAKRWEDVQALLNEGIDVLTNMNIQHLESLNDHMFSITGVRVRETVPDWFVKSADEVVMVDATTEALLNRLRRGVIYAPEKAQRAMDNFFKPSTLAALRELALRQTAHELEFRDAIAAPDAALGTAQASAAPKSESRDRILIYVTADSCTAMLIRRGRRMADYLGADSFALSVAAPASAARANPEGAEAIEKHLNFAKNLHIETRAVESKDTAEAIVDFARSNRITHIILGRVPCSAWDRLRGADIVLQVVDKAKEMRVIIVAERRAPK